MNVDTLCLLTTLFWLPVLLKLKWMAQAVERDVSARDIRFSLFDPLANQTTIVLAESLSYF